MRGYCLCKVTEVCETAVGSSHSSTSPSEMISPDLQPDNGLVSMPRGEALDEAEFSASISKLSEFSSILSGALATLLVAADCSALCFMLLL